MAIPMGGTSLQTSQVQDLKTSASQRTEGASGSGFRSSITNNLAFGGSSLSAQTGESKMPVLVYVVGAVVAAGLLWLVYKRRIA